MNLEKELLRIASKWNRESVTEGDSRGAIKTTTSGTTITFDLGKLVSFIEKNYTAKSTRSNRTFKVNRGEELMSKVVLKDQRLGPNGYPIYLISDPMRLSLSMSKETPVGEYVQYMSPQDSPEIYCGQILKVFSYPDSISLKYSRPVMFHSTGSNVYSSSLFRNVNNPFHASRKLNNSKKDQKYKLYTEMYDLLERINDSVFELRIHSVGGVGNKYENLSLSELIGMIDRSSFYDRPKIFFIDLVAFLKRLDFGFALISEDNSPEFIELGMEFGKEVSEIRKKIDKFEKLK